VLLYTSFFYPVSSVFFLQPMSNRYDDLYKRSLEDPEGFWASAAEDVHWYKKWERVLDDSRAPFYRWFPGGVVNSCYDALDRHVAEGIGDQPALIYDSPVTDTIKSFTYRELRDNWSCRFP
jgi:propionyl-CoA synthetase